MAALNILFLLLFLIAPSCVAAQKSEPEAPKKAEEERLAKAEAKPKYTRTYNSESTVDIEMPEFEEGYEEEPEPESLPEEVIEEPEEKTEEPVIEEEAPVAIEPEPEPVAETEPQETPKEEPQEEPAPIEEPANEDPLGGDDEWDDFVNDMQGIIDRKEERSSLTPDLVQVFPVADEMILGEGVAARVLAGTPEFPNDALWEYVTFVGLSLVEHCMRNELPYYFIVLDTTEDINAFAAPGGFIFITTGAIKLCENEAELAAILAHEIAHISHRHGIKMLDLSKYRSMMQGMVNEMDEAFGKSDFYDLDSSMSPRLKELEQELSAVADQSFNQMLNPFSQDMEFEADTESLRIMTHAGYNPFSSLMLLERLRTLTGDIPAYAKALHSHPPTVERIQSLKSLIEKAGLQNAGALNKERFLHYTRVISEQ